jgi:hypothetical protein
MHHWQLEKAIHEIKAAGKLRGPDRVITYDNGTVTDEGGEHLVNIYDEL